jgi:hypothetical protein
MRQMRHDEPTAALRVAIDLNLIPSRLRSIKADVVPDGVLLLLLIAAGDQDAADRAARRVGKSVECVQEAAAFYIEQILLAYDSDRYRVLGAQRDATATELRRNLALILRWLQSDRAHLAGRSIFFSRVTSAWNDLKTPGRRAAYDAALNRRDTKFLTERKNLSGRRSIKPKNSDKTRRGKGMKFVPSGSEFEILILRPREQMDLLRRLIRFGFSFRT